MMNRQHKSKISYNHKSNTNEINHTTYMTNDTRTTEVSKEKNREKSKVSSNNNISKNTVKVSVNLDKFSSNNVNVNVNKLNSTPKQTQSNIINFHKRSNNIKQAIYNEMVNLNDNHHKRNKNGIQLYNNNKAHNVGKSTTQSTSFLINTNNTKPSISQTKTNSLVTTAIKENTLKTNILMKSINEETGSLQSTMKQVSNFRDLSNPRYETNNSKLINKLESSSARKDTIVTKDTKSNLSPSLGKKNNKNPTSLIKGKILDKHKDVHSNLNETLNKSKPSRSLNKTSTKSDSNSIKKDYSKLTPTYKKKMPNNLNFTGVNRSKERSNKKEIKNKTFNMTVVSNKSNKLSNCSFNTNVSPKVKSSNLNVHNFSSSMKSSNNNINLMNNPSDDKQSCIDKKIIFEKYIKVLKDIETDEIKNTKEIYFLGKIPQRFLKENTLDNINIDGRESNGGSQIEESSSLIQSINNSKVTAKSNDDENGNFIVNKGDHIMYRYEIINELGRGSFGQALKCIDHKYNKQCCVKIIKNNKKFISQAKIEIKILKYIRNADSKSEANIVKVYDSFVFRNHICIVFELLDINLYEFLKNQDFKGMDLNVIRKIAVQLLYTMIFLKKHSIIHCDLKLENILLRKNGKTGIKVIDFGSSCFENEKLYSYIQSRFYRAPEVILGIGYGIEIDMWSFGCIMAELYNGIPIFPGENERDQLNYIMEYLGVPSHELILYSKKRSLFFDDNLVPLQTPNSRGKIRMPNTKKLERFLRGADPNFIDFVSKCLIFDPNNRISPDDAILHPWIISGIPKEILNFHKSLIEQTREADKQTRSVDKVKPKTDLKKPNSNFISYQTHSQKVESNIIQSKDKANNYSKKSKAENSFANKSK